MTQTPAPGFKTNPDYRITFERSPRRVRVQFNGEWVADSTAAHLLFETRHLPIYYFPRADVRMDLLRATEHHTYCPYKGTASYWSIAVGNRVSENAVWGYPEPFAEVAAIENYVAFYWDRVDHWFEEDDEIFVHARDPYKRVDVVNSSRRVTVIVDSDDAVEAAAKCKARWGDVARIVLLKCKAADLFPFGLEPPVMQR